MPVLRPGCMGALSDAHTHKMYPQPLDQTCQGKERPALPGILEGARNMVKIISVRQPWAWLIVAGHKDIENRTWRTSYRGSLLIHASQAMEENDFPVQREWIKTWNEYLIAGDESPIVIPEDLPRGAIVGAVNLTDVWGDGVNTSVNTVTHPRMADEIKHAQDNPWFEGPYGFEMADAVEFAEPIPWRGQLGIRDVSDALAARVPKMTAK